jgi:serine/threonine protein kinase
VFLARQKSMQRLVAVKISADQGTEPQTLAQLDHDHIVRVYDQRVLAEEGLRLLYMQYLPGGTLQQVVELLHETPPEQRNGAVYFRAVDRALEERGESRPVESDLRKKLAHSTWPEVVCWIGSRLAAALAYAHRKGVLHRDIKPANVLISADGAPKLADFNISFSSKLEGVSPAAHFGGSFAYMSPEHLEAFHPGHIRQPDSLDQRCDIFSLGVLLWELLCGQRPFPDDTLDRSWSKALAALIDRHRSGVEPAAVAQLPAQTPNGLKRVLLKCLAPNPADRWQSGEELALQLELCGLHETEELLFPAETTWRVRLRPLAVPLVVLGAAAPNLLAARFNWLYNRKEIVEQLSEASLERFDQIQLVINAVAFPLGLGLLGCLAHRIISRWKVLSLTTRTDPDVLLRARTACLRLGHWAALIGVSLWTIAGVAYPVSLHVAAGAMPLRDYPHFFFSLLLCGLLAAAYPFFLVTLIQVTTIYPALLQLKLPAVEDRPELQRLSRLAWAYLLMAVLVPLLSLTALVGIGSQARYALAVLSAGGLIGCGVAFWLFRKLQADVAALLPATEEHQF